MSTALQNCKINCAPWETGNYNAYHIDNYWYKSYVLFHCHNTTTTITGRDVKDWSLDFFYLRFSPK